MLARPNRLTRGAEYRTVVRRGAKCAAANTITYVVASGEQRSARFGFIVSKQVGTAVTRNRVRRRLKAVCADALPAVRPGADIVVRALAASATAEYATLRAEVTQCLARRAAA